MLGRYWEVMGGAGGCWEVMGKCCGGSRGVWVGLWGLLGGFGVVTPMGDTGGGHSGQHGGDIQDNECWGNWEGFWGC